MLRCLGRSEPFGRVGLVIATIALALVCLAAPVASAAGLEYDLIKAFGPNGTDSTGFDFAEAIAVDKGNDIVYVLDDDESLFKFDLEGNPVDFGGSSPDVSGNELSGLPVGGGRLLVAVNPLTHTIYVTVESKTNGPARGGVKLLAFKPNGEEALFTAGTNAITTAPLSIEALTVASNGDIYVTKGGYFEGTKFIGGHISVYNEEGAEILPEVIVPGVAFNPTGRYLAVRTNGELYIQDSGVKGVDKYVPSVYPLSASTTYAGNGEFDIGLNTGFDLDALTNELYVARSNPVNEISVYDDDEELQPLGSFAGPGEPGELNSSHGVAVDPGSERVFVPQNPKAGLSQVKIFEPHRCICPPAIESSRVSQVSADAAKLLAKVNPDTFDSTYWFEYGPEDCELGPCAKAPLQGAPIAAGFKAVAVSRAITGLSPKTLYHFRVVAKNQEGTTEGPDKTFTTQGSGLGFQLADSRVWEMVSPSDKHGGSLALRRPGIIQAATDGDGLAYLTLGSIEADPEGNRAIEASSVLAQRGAGGWQSKDITPPHTELTRPRDAEYRLMNADLSRALMEARDDTPLSPLTTERTPYIRENTEPALFTPLLTAAEGYANVPPGTKFGEEAIHPVGANPDLNTVAFRSGAPLVEGAAGGSLYAWSGGQIKAVSQLPPDKKGKIATVEASLGSNLGSVRNAISADGSRVFWTPGGGYNASGISLTALYLRDTTLEATIRLNLIQAGIKEPGPPRPAFQIASTDGTVVYFTDSQHLTNTASPEGRDLYRCEIPAGESLGGCATLTDVSAPREGSGESAQVKDQALAASEDGSRAYFVAEAVLDAEPNVHGDKAIAKAPNLYLSEAGEGVRFIATLSKKDQANWGAATGQPNGYAGNLAADASPDGRYLAFMSNRSLAGYDNETTAGEAVQEAYRYDAQSGELTCISCNPTGGSPQATLISSASVLKVDVAELWGEQWVAATLPEARSQDFGDTFYRPRTVLDDGRVFFNAYDALVPADSNGGWDVYQYESTDTGSCSAESGDAATVRSGEGCVGLVSSGTAEEEAAFLDSSLSGDDVFFLSSSKLSVLDEDTVYDVYDARVNGVVAQLPDLAECQGESCQPVVAAPDDPTPSSSSFEGAGNVPPEGKAPTQARCPKGKHQLNRNGKTVCVAKKKHRKHRKQRRYRTHHHRGAAR